MAIWTIKEPDIFLTASEQERPFGEYQRETQNWYGVNPLPSFETWVRRRKASRADSLCGAA
jgi:hypothetical protein